jgi:uncharacterized protein YejL (UPF0352 family)
MTNPICPRCFSRHVSYWLKDKNISQKDVKEIISEMISIINEAEESPADTSCIVCGERKVNLCTFCFTNKARNVMEKTLESVEILSEFEEDFNTIIWRV